MIARSSGSFGRAALRQHGGQQRRADPVVVGQAAAVDQAESVHWRRPARSGPPGSPRHRRRSWPAARGRWPPAGPGPPRCTLSLSAAWSRPAGISAARAPRPAAAHRPQRFRSDRRCREAKRFGECDASATVWLCVARSIAMGPLRILPPTVDHQRGDPGDNPVFDVLAVPAWPGRKALVKRRVDDHAGWLRAVERLNAPGRPADPGGPRRCRNR